MLDDASTCVSSILGRYRLTFEPLSIPRSTDDYLQIWRVEGILQATRRGFSLLIILTRFISDGFSVGHYGMEFPQ